MNKLKVMRHKARMAQKDVAAAVGVDRSSVDKWENGISVPWKKNRRKLAALYGVSEDELLQAFADANAGLKKRGGYGYEQDGGIEEAGRAASEGRGCGAAH